jgi:bacterioferritin
MKGAEAVIKLIEAALDGEARAILQYQADSVIFENMGLGGLAKYTAKLMDDEREHMKQFLDRLIFLETSPKIEIQGVNTVSPEPRRASPVKIFSLNQTLETTTIDLYSRACRTCIDEGDFVSFGLFREILTDEEEHLNWLESQLDLVAQIGENAYIQAEISEA